MRDFSFNSKRPKLKTLLLYGNSKKNKLKPYLMLFSLVKDNAVEEYEVLLSLGPKENRNVSWEMVWVSS